MKRTLTACLFASATALTGLASAQTVSLDESAFALGTLSRSDGALEQDIWTGAEPDALMTLLATMPRSYGEPAYLDLARRLLLSPATAPEGANNALAGAKLLAAAEAGFYREAGELAELAPALAAEPDLTRVAALSALLDGDVRTACQRGARLTQGRSDPFFLRLRYLCYVDADETNAADLTLGLLTDQGVLSDGGERMFTALQTSGDPGSSISPQDAFEYAAAQMLGTEVSVQAVPELPGSVLAAVARDTDADADLRVPALERALSLGLIGAEEGQRLAAEMASTPLAAEVVAVATEAPGSVGSAEAIARSLQSAPDYDGFRARAVLYRRTLSASEPVLGYAPFADVLALGAMVGGEPAAARKWIGALQSEPAADPAQYDDLVSLYRIVTGEERVLSVPLSDPLANGTSDVATLVATALDAAGSGSRGTAALVALNGLGVEAEGDLEGVRESVVQRMLARSGLSQDVARRIAFDTQASALFAGMTGGPVRKADASGDPVPRIKPEAR